MYLNADMCRTSAAHHGGRNERAAGCAGICQGESHDSCAHVLPFVCSGINRCTQSAAKPAAGILAFTGFTFLLSSKRGGMFAVDHMVSSLLQVLLRVSRRKWRWRGQTIDQLLHVPEEVPQEALELLSKCAPLSQLVQYMRLHCLYVLHSCTVKRLICIGRSSKRL